MKFYETPSSWSRVVPCGLRKKERERDGLTDMTKVIVTFANFSKAPKK